MELIIKIPDEDLHDIQCEGIKFVRQREMLWRAIENGIPLPKGHGRLVDENPVIAQLVYRKNLLADNVTCGEVTKIFDSAVVVEAEYDS